MNAADIQVVYQDHHLLIINKPAGVVIHPTYKHADDTLWNALLTHLALQEKEDWQPPMLPDKPAWKLAPPHVQSMLRQKRLERYWREEGLLPRPCLLHRLDKDTSGIVALARTERSRRYLVQQFHDHTIIKRYLAVVRRGAPHWAQPRTTLTLTHMTQHGPQTWPTNELFAASASDQLLLSGPLRRDPDDRRRCIVMADGQEATTMLHVLAVERDCALLDVRPITGRTHQIRAHLAALGYTIVGDQTYTSPEQHTSQEAGLTRQFLHASSLTLRSYPGGLPVTFVAPLATELASWLGRYYRELLSNACEHTEM